MKASELSKPVTRCTRCVISSNFPGADFDDKGVCRLCRDEPEDGSVDELRKAMLGQMEEMFAKLRSERKGEYDVVVALSGGKDSTYTLKLLADDYDLRCLAVTIDNGFLSDQAVVNCNVVTDKLGVDFIMFKPATDFMKKMYRESLKGDLHAPAAIRRASDICNSCINLINTRMIKIALTHNVSLIAGGYLGGQVPKGSAMLSLDINRQRAMRTVSNQKLADRLGPDAERFFGLPTPAEGEQASVNVVNPLLAMKYDLTHIYAEIGKLGWVKPKDTGGHSSNCQLNDFGILTHFRKHGFHPYEMELAELVRKGFMDRAEAIEKLEAMPDPKVMKPIAAKLGYDNVESA
jgi:hypothetical protein